jgi:uncharacterized protein with ParB-like and HNH nuclease domain
MGDQAYLNSTQHSVSWFNKIHQQGELELNPPFQRNPVWTDKQKSYLIDTILNGYPVPELYMQEYASADGRESMLWSTGNRGFEPVLSSLKVDFS